MFFNLSVHWHVLFEYTYEIFIRWKCREDKNIFFFYIYQTNPFGFFLIKENVKIIMIINLILLK